MIKVLLNGTPIYKLCFSRKRFKTVNRKRPGLNDVLQALDKTYGYNTGTTLKQEVYDAIRQVFGGKPLYETTALVYIVDAKRGEPPVATASTRQSKLDDNSRATGREVALGRLLRTKDITEKDKTYPPPFSEVERKAIRAAYENRFPKATKPTPPSSAGSAPIAQVRRRLEAVNSHPVMSQVISLPSIRETRLTA